MEHVFSQLIESIGENLDRPGLKETPERAAKAFEFLTQGYQQDLATVVNGAVFPADSNNMVIVSNIEFYSLCEHHLLPFMGKCHVAYLPNNKIIGLSKVARIVDMYARRLQVQENLTREIAEAIQLVTEAESVSVIIDAEHLCMKMRGVKKQDPTMKTTVNLGQFQHDPQIRAELFSLL